MPSLEDAQLVGRAFAVALGDSGVRADVRDILRASPFVEHKAPLRKVVASAAGQRLMQMASRGIGMAPESFLSLVRSLPEMDMYMPRSSDRREWQATDRVVVAIMVDGNAPPAGSWNTRGVATKVERQGTDAILVIEPSEVRDLRVNPQPRLSGNVIQDADDGDWGGALKIFNARGKLVKETQLAVLLRSRIQGIGTRTLNVCDPEAIYCDPEEGAGGGGGGLASDTTLVTRFVVDNGLCDGWFCGNNELEFRSNAYDENNQWVDSRTLRINSGCYYRAWDSCSNLVDKVLMFLRIRDNTTQQIKVELVEIDVWNNDEMGNRYFAWNDNGQARSISGGGYTSHLTMTWTPIQ